MSSSVTEMIDVTMPQMGVSVAEGTVVEWKKQPGDRVEADELICSISTDKIDTDVESPAGGWVAERLVEVGATVEVGVVLARIATDAPPAESPGGSNGAEASASANTTEAGAALEAPGAAGELQGDEAIEHPNSVTERTPTPSRGGGPRRYSPVVLRVAAEHAVDLEAVTGTGRDGRVRKQDVLALVEDREVPAAPMHIESPYRPDPVPPKPAAVPDGDLGPAIAEPLSRMRQAIGSRMLASLTETATCTTIVECDMGRVEAARLASGLTYLPYVAAATVATLREEAFASLNATLEDGAFTRYESVHLGIAVSLGAGGLIVPVIRHAQELSAEGLARRVKELAGKARANALTPDDVRGGTFTITNPGAFGAIMATPVINLPQVAILDSEAVVKRAVVVTDAEGEDSIAIRPMTYFCMSWDHRALDGVLAAQFLSAVSRRLEAWPAA